MQQQQMQIFGNGAVFTGVRARPWVEAVVTRGADVAAVGSLSELREAWPQAEVIDLAGGTLLPGLIDAHNHFLSTGESLASWDLRYPGVDSADALLRVVREAADAAAPGETLSGFGFDNAKYPLPSLAELDAASGDHPLQFFHTSGHNVLVNSRGAGQGRGRRAHDRSAGWTVRAGRRWAPDRALPRLRLRGGRADRGRHRVARPELPHARRPSTTWWARSTGRARPSAPQGSPACPTRR